MTFQGNISDAKSLPMSKLEMLQRIRSHCLECVGTSHAVKNCPMPECKLYYLRLGAWVKRQNPDGTIKKGFKKPEIRKAVREECNVCMNGKINECVSPNCKLYYILRNEKTD